MASAPIKILAVENSYQEKNQIRYFGTKQILDLSETQKF